MIFNNRKDVVFINDIVIVFFIMNNVGVILMLM